MVSLIDQENGAELCRRGLRRPHGLRALCDAGLRPGQGRSRGLRQQSQGRRPHSRQARHLHLRRHAARSLRADDRAVTLAEERLAKNRKTVFVSAQLPQQVPPRPMSRRSCAAPAASKTARSKARSARLILEFRSQRRDPQLRQRRGAARYSQAGVITPDPTIRIKSWPLILPAPEPARSTTSSARRTTRVAAFIDNYKQLFRPPQRARRRHQDNARSAAARRAGAGARPVRPRTDQERRAIAADLAEAAIAAITDAEAIGRFKSIPKTTCSTSNTGRSSRPSSARAKEPPLAGQIVVDHRRRRRHRRRDRPGLCRGRRRGRAARCRRGRRRGRPSHRPRRAAGAPATSPTRTSVGAAFDQVVEAFGGVDIVVSNAGAAWQGRIGEVDEDDPAQEFRAEFLRPPARRAGRGEDHAGARHRRLPAVQRLQAGGQSGSEFRPLRLAQGRDPVAGAPIRGRLRRGRHPLQRRQRRPHPLRPAHRRLHQGSAPRRAASPRRTT